MKKIIIYSLVYLFNFSILSFNLIKLDEALTSHQNAFKEFEQYVSSCKVDVLKYRSFNSDITERSYDFDSIEASKSFEIYKKANQKLLYKMYSSAIIKGWLFGALTSCFDVIYKNYLLDEKTLFLNLLGSAAIILQENAGRPKEPYFNPKKVTKHKDLFGTLDYHTGKRILIVMAQTQICRMLSEFVIKR
jgi:hypothetical protein